MSHFYNFIYILDNTTDQTNFTNLIEINSNLDESLIESILVEPDQEVISMLFNKICKL